MRNISTPMIYLHVPNRIYGYSLSQQQYDGKFVFFNSSTTSVFRQISAYSKRIRKYIRTRNEN